MKVEVIAEFKDRTDGLKLVKVGTVLEVTEERANKLLGMRLVKVVEEPAQTEAAPEQTVATPEKKTGTRKTKAQ